MATSDTEHGAGAPRTARFATTRWSVVLAAQERPVPEAREALAVLFETYWYPLYAFVRRMGFGRDDAEDLTQGFIARLLEKEYVKDFDRDRGRFRTFLLTALKHYISKERDRARAKKRGGGTISFSLDVTDAEERYRLEPSHDLTPEKIFERRWARTLLDRVVQRLGEEYAAADKGALFDELKPVLTKKKSGHRYREIGAELGLTEGAVKVAVHRMRRRYRDALREEIAQTVADPGEIEDEIRYLLSVLGS